MSKVPDPKIVAEIKGLSLEARGETVHTVFNGLTTIRAQIELGLDNGVSREELLGYIDKTGDWLRSELKQTGFIGG